jgi:hypothetical protein
MSRTTATDATFSGPVFVVGCPRSGTTLLQRMLDAHPSVAIAGETHFVGRFWLKRNEYGDLREDSHFERILGDIAAMPEFGEMDLDSGEFRRRAREGERAYASLFALLLSMYRERTGAALVGEKTPDHLIYAPVLADFFPSARFIHIVRDPRAVVNSRRRMPWAATGVFENAEIWHKYMRYASRFPQHIQRALLSVSYEALVTRPEHELRGICGFLDLPFHPAMLKYYESAPANVDTSREPWKAAVTKPLDACRLDEWRTALSAPMIATIEGTVWRDMRRWGYHHETGFARLVPAVASATFRRFVGRAKRRTRHEVRRLLRRGSVKEPARS